MIHQFKAGEISPCDLARKLIAEGKAVRSDKLQMLRDGQSALTGTVGWFADRRIQETAKVGPRYVKWTPFLGIASREQAAKNPPEAE